jgi:hypothetical protein
MIHPSELHIHIQTNDRYSGRTDCLPGYTTNPSLSPHELLNSSTRDTRSKRVRHSCDRISAIFLFLKGLEAANAFELEDSGIAGDRGWDSEKDLQSTAQPLTTTAAHAHGFSSHLLNLSLRQSVHNAILHQAQGGLQVVRKRRPWIVEQASPFGFADFEAGLFLEQAYCLFRRSLLLLSEWCRYS